MQTCQDEETQCQGVTSDTAEPVSHRTRQNTSHVYPRGGIRGKTGNPGKYVVKRSHQAVEKRYYGSRG